jgi:MATE family multidrug resistance protein
MGMARRASPIYLSMIATVINASVDVALLGRSGTSELAAFTVVMSFYIPATVAVTGALRGVTPFVVAARAQGSAVRAVVRDGLAAGGVAALVAVLVLGLLLATIASATTDEPILVLGVLLGASLAVVASAAGCVAVLVGLERGRDVLAVGLAGAGAGVVASLLLIPSHGLNGAGLSMLVAAVVQLLVAGSATARAMRAVGDAERSPRAPEAARMRAIAAVGLPLAATVLVKFAVLGVLGLASAGVSDVDAASWSVGTSLLNLTTTFAIAVGVASIPVTGAALVAGDERRLRAGVLVAARAALVLIGALGVTAVVLGDHAVRLFTSDPAVVDTAGPLLPLVALAACADGAQAVVGFGLVGIRRTRPSLVAFVVVYGALAVAAIPLSSAGGVRALWSALVVANLLLVAWQYIAFARGSRGVRPTSEAPVPSN